MNPFRNHRIRQQAEKAVAMDSRQRAEEKMRAMAMQQGREALMKHVGVKVQEIVPAWCRAVAKWLPPKTYFAAMGKLAWLVMQPGRLVSWLVFAIFVKPAVWVQRHIWQFGCYTEISKIDECNVKVEVHRWFHCRYMCRFNMISHKVDQEEVG